MHYDYFELGLCDKLAINTHELTNEIRVMLKLAYYEQQPQQQHSGLPWGKMALTALLAGGGAYAHGRLAQNSPLAGFSQGVDDNLVNPIMQRIRRYTTSPMDEAEGMYGRVNDAAQQAKFQGINSPQDAKLQGTEYYQPGKLEGAANRVQSGVMPALEGGMALGTAKAMGNYALPKTMSTVGAQIAGSGLARSTIGGAAKTVGGFALKSLPVIGAAASMPDNLQLGDKMVDYARQHGHDSYTGWLVNNTRWGAPVVKGLTTAAGTMLSLGGGVGNTFKNTLYGIGKMVAPMAVNQTLNYKNQANLLANETAGRAGQLKTEFNGAMDAQNHGNTNPIKAWYGLQDQPGQLKGTIDQFRDQPILQKQMQTNAPL